MGQTYSLKDVAEHNKAESLWIIIHGSVYDVTKFIAEHPGGEKVIMDFAGKDATDGFEKKGHSASARRWLRLWKIGCLEGQQKWYEKYLWPTIFVTVGAVGIAVVAGAVAHRVKQ